jgi:mono/diheme cytochrome c family protein
MARSWITTTCLALLAAGTLSACSRRQAGTETASRPGTDSTDTAAAAVPPPEAAVVALGVAAVPGLGLVLIGPTGHPVYLVEDSSGTPSGDAWQPVTGRAAPAKGDTAVAGKSGHRRREVAAGPGAITPAMVARGDSICHGRIAAGSCYLCHGPLGKGTPRGPGLTDQEWLDCDGSYGSIVRVIANGVPRPRRYPNGMPPTGGVPLAPEQVREVAAPVHELSHPAREHNPRQAGGSSPMDDARSVAHLRRTRR